MATTCTTKISAGLDASCLALDKIGGVEKTIYFGNLSEITFTENGALYIDSVTLTASPPAYLYKFVGKTKKHMTGNALQVGANTNTWKQAVTAKLNYFYPSERTAIEALCNADDLVAFVQMASGLFEVYGYAKGIRCESATDSSGALINDDTSITIVISGEETELPKVLQLGAALPGAAAYLTQNIDALDLLC